MKKVLALVLALALAIGTSGFAAAAPEDVMGTEYEGAVEKLVYLGIIAGYPDGTYRPDRPVTRAEFAKIIITALGIGEAAQYAAGATRFPDVGAGHWASGYINVAVDLGIIAGYPDGTFKPENPVTYAEAIKMIVAALGYTPKAESMGGYPGGYLAIAAEKEISDGVTVAGALAANRGDIALLIDNALTVPMMVQKTWGQYPEYAEDKEQTLMKKLGVDEVEGRIVEIPRVSAKLDDDEIKIRYIDEDDREKTETYRVIAAVDLELAFGQEVTAYVKKDKIIGLTIESDYFLDAIEVDDDELTLVQEDEDYDFAEDGVIVWVNGDDDYDADDLDGNAYDYAKVVLNDDGDVAFIDAYVWDDILLVEDVDDEVAYGYGDELDLEDYTIVKNGRTIAIKDIKKGDLLFYCEDAEFAEVYNEILEGEIDRVYTDAFKVDGKVFDFEFEALSGGTMYVDGDKLDIFDADVAEDMEDEGEEVIVYMDRNGFAVLVIGETGDKDTTALYAFVIEDSVKFGMRGKDYFTLDVINESGKEVNYDIAKDDAVEWGIAEWIDPDDHSKGANAVLSAGAVVKIEVDEDGDLEEVTVLNAAALGKTFGVDDRYAAGYRLQGSAVVFDIEDYVDDVDDIIVSTFGELDYDDVEDGDIYVDEKDRVVVIVVNNSSREADLEYYTAVVIDEVKKVKGKNIWELEVNIGGKEKTYETEKDKVAAAKINAIEVGDFVELEVNEKTGEVTDVTILTGSAREVRNLEVVSRSTRDRTVTVKGVPNNVLYRLDDATILDAGDGYEVIAIRNLDAGDIIKLLLVASGSSYVEYLVVNVEPDEDPGLIDSFDVLEPVSIDQGEPLNLTITDAKDAQSRLYNGKKDVLINMSEFEGFIYGLLIEDVVFVDGEATIPVLEGDDTNIKAQTKNVTVTIDGSTDTFSLTVNQVVSAEDSTLEIDGPLEAGAAGKLTITVVDLAGDAVPGLAEADFIVTAAPGSGTVTVNNFDDANAANGVYTFDIANDTIGETLEVTVEVDGVTLNEKVNLVTNKVISFTVDETVSINQGEALVISISNARDIQDNLFNGVRDVSVNTSVLEGIDHDATIEDVVFDDGNATLTVLQAEDTAITAQEAELTVTIDGSTGTFSLTINQAVSAENSSIASVDNEDGTAAITVTVLDLAGNAVAGLAAADFAGDDGTGAADFAAPPFSGFDDADNINGVYKVLYSNSAGDYQVAITVRGVEIGTVTVNVSDN